MSNAPPPLKLDTSALLGTLDELALGLAARVEVRSERVGELRRQAAALAYRRGGKGSLDARKYALGSVLPMLMLEHSTDTELLGLFSHPDQMLRWMVGVRAEHGPMSFGQLVDAVLADDAQRRWCEQWGRVLQWRYRKPLYDATVESFITSGRAGPKERWRSHDITDDQAALIVTLTLLLEESVPTLRTRGEAFDWIRERGGNPAYWQEPTNPDEVGE